MYARGVVHLFTLFPTLLGEGGCRCEWPPQKRRAAPRHVIWFRCAGLLNQPLTQELLQASVRLVASQVEMRRQLNSRNREFA